MRGPRGTRTAPPLTPELRNALETLVRVVERQSRDFAGSVLLVRDGRLHDVAGARLPTPYREAIDGEPVREGGGSCGTAAWRGRRVIVSDIATDPLWVDYRDLAAAHGLAACWSEPILSSEGSVIGTFALYYDEPRSPSAADIQIIEAAAARAALVFERSRAGGTAEELLAGLE